MTISQSPKPSTEDSSESSTAQNLGSHTSANPSNNSDNLNNLNNRAKTNTVTGLVYAQDSMAGQARMIGSLQTIGIDDRVIASLPAKLDEVSLADIYCGVIQ